MIRVRRKGSVLGDLGAGVERLIGALSPAAAMKRAGVRALEQQIHRLGATGSYDGAQKSRSWINRATSGGSADADLNGDTLAELRERSRDRDRNDPIAHALIESLVDNVVGIGFRPVLALDYRRLGISKERATALREQARWIWEDWSEHADSTNRLSMEDIQAMTFGQSLVNGDMFLAPVMVQDARVRSTYETKLELIEADRIDSPIGLQNDRIRSGVELGRRGQPIAYWIAEQHPGDERLPGAAGIGTRSFKRIPAHDKFGNPRVIHVFRQERPGQSRGRPALSVVLNALKDRNDYKEAEIIAAQVGACFAAFITKTDPFSAAIARATADTKSEQDRHEELSPGAFYYMSPGEDVKLGDPSRPTSVFSEFLNTTTREICSAVGQPLEIAMRDFSGTTYSQARALLLEVRRSYVCRRKWLIRAGNQPIWRMVLEEAWLKGEFDAGNDFLEHVKAWTRTSWVPQGWGWIDPEKEGKAWALQLEMGVATRQKIIGSHDGDNFEDVTEQLADEKELRQEFGLESAAAAPTEPEDDAEDESEQEGDQDEDEDEQDSADEAEQEQEQEEETAEVPA